MVEIRHFIAIEATPKDVYEALTTDRGLGAWWTADSKAERRVEGSAEFGFDNREVVFRMKIEELEPERRVVWSCEGDNPEWAGTRLTWEIEAAEAATHLRFVQSGWRKITDFAASCNSMWGELLFRLKDYLEGKGPGPRWTE